MLKAETPLLPIKKEDYEPYKAEITTYLKSVKWTPDKAKTQNDKIDLTFLLHNKALGVAETDELSILKNAVRVSNDRVLLSNPTIYTVHAIRDGLSIGKYLASLYEKSSGLESLLLRNKESKLHQSEQPEFHSKMETQSIILLFVAAYYIVWRLNSYESETVSAINIDFGGIPEVKFNRPSRAISNVLYYYAAYLERSGVVNNDLEMVKMTLLYFERLIEEINLRKPSLNHTSYFTNVQYKLENTDFIVDGFDTQITTTVHSIVFNKTPMEAIVANHEAKHMFKRFAERLICHDITTGKNPMLELGGLPSITMADGKPGTGKSMLIAATATLLQEWCAWLELPFLFWPLPENIISTYQGGSAERAVEWFKPMQDSNKIIFAPIDDAENNLEERTRQGVSAGVREFIGVFLRNTEGAYAVNNGNRLISLFTNIPDQIDKAVLSRVQVRVPIDGAKTPEDFIDQDHIWWKRYAKIMPGFVDTDNPKGYKFMENQKDIQSLSEVYSGDYEFNNERVEEIFYAAKKVHNPSSHAFFGNFYNRVLELFPFFSSRDLRNIQKAIDARIIDFDLPKDWWENPETFFKKDYTTKLNMLKELTQANMGGLSFDEIRLREAINYIETAIRINETGIEREIELAAKRMHISNEAHNRLKSNKITF